MAAIDKIYGTQKQYLELRDWLLENEVPIRCETGDMFNEDDELVVDYQVLLLSSRLYTEKGYNKDHRPIANFLPEMDMWLMENCPIEFVQERLKEQYPTE